MNDFRTRNQRVTDDVGHIELLEVIQPQLFGVHAHLQ
jgi:hypothetical protein